MCCAEKCLEKQYMRKNGWFMLTLIKSRPRIVDVSMDISTLFTPPVTVKGMKSLDKSAFRKVIQLPALRIEAKTCSLFLKNLSKSLLNQPRTRNIVPDLEPSKSGGNLTKKVLLLRPGRSLDSLSSEEREFAKNHKAEELSYNLEVNYVNWSADQVLRAVLPGDVTEVPTSFETIGHIAHLNLRECHLDYKDIIGEVILDKNSPQIKTVVNKINVIDETFRFFKMEVLTGDSNMQTCVKEGGCTYKFDFSKVYWNSRLQTEHKRLVDNFSCKDVVCDMFAGVGPFAVPAAKVGCRVYANDLNPDSYTALVNNARLNQVEEKIHAFNMDAREFVRQLVAEETPGKVQEKEKSSGPFSQVIMNLPASAVEFLDVFKGLFHSGKYLKLPTIHCYCFSKSQTPCEDAKEQVEKVLGSKLSTDCLMHYVRDVAPKKAMICVSFKLPEAIACQSIEDAEATQLKRKGEVSENPDSKQARLKESIETSY